MKPCDTLLDQLDAALANRLDAELAAHLAACPTCQGAVARARGLAEGSTLLDQVRAPRTLVARLKTLPRLALPCEQAILVIDDAFAGELEEEGRGALLDHVDACPRCRATWEASATLREVGAATVAPSRLRRRLAAHPGHRSPARQSRRWFDLRLATAAAYLLAAVSVLLAGNPASIARVGSAELDRASLYARAAVVNRVQACSEAALEQGEAIRAWVGDRVGEVWSALRDFFGPRKANRAAAANVVTDGNGG